MRQKSRVRAFARAAVSIGFALVAITASAQDDHPDHVGLANAVS